MAQNSNLKAQFGFENLWYMTVCDSQSQHHHLDEIRLSWEYVKLAIAEGIDALGF